jgi:hypothetical protein
VSGHEFTDDYILDEGKQLCYYLFMAKLNITFSSVYAVPYERPYPLVYAKVLPAALPLVFSRMFFATDSLLSSRVF